MSVELPFAESKVAMRDETLPVPPVRSIVLCEDIATLV